MNYVIEKIGLDGFDLLVVKLTHESLFDFIEDLEAEDLVTGSGKLIVDQLLSTGYGKNRFVVLPFEDGRLRVKKAELIVNRPDLENEASKIFRNHPSFLENSILNEEERSAILNE